MDPRTKRLRTVWILSCFVFLMTMTNVVSLGALSTIRTVDFLMIFASGMAFGAVLATTVAVIKNARATRAIA